MRNSALPVLPRARHVARGYYTSAYYVVEPKQVPLGEAILAFESVEEFDPEEEPDYFAEFGYPDPQPENLEPKQVPLGEPQTIVFCHGLAANGLQFVTDAHYFASRGFRVIVPDLRGHGRSTCPVQRHNEDFSIDILLADLIAILDAENVGCVHWVGNSLGGILGLSLMDSDPARLQSFTSFGTAYALSVPAFAVRAGIWFYRLLGAQWLARMGAPLTSKKPDVQALIYAMLNKMDLDAVSRIASYLGNYDLSENALRFQGPILMLQGDTDAQVNRALKKTLAPMSARPRFTRLSIPGAGHVTNLDQPDKVREAVLRFLKF